MEETGASPAERFFNAVSRSALVEALLRIIAAAREPLVHTGAQVHVVISFGVIFKNNELCQDKCLERFLSWESYCYSISVDSLVISAI